MGHLLDLPNEILSVIIQHAVASAPSRQRRRIQLLTIGRACHALNELCLRQIYSKLAYEISPKGLKLLNTLSKNQKLCKYVRAAAVREKESGNPRKLVNSRVQEANVTAGKEGSNGEASYVQTRRGRRNEVEMALVLGTILTEEQRINRFLTSVKDGLVELQYETNLMPSENKTLSELHALQHLLVVPQPPYPEAGTQDALLASATFTLSLPSPIFISAFTSLSSLTVLDLWKCSFIEFEGKLGGLPQPSFSLNSLILEDCDLSGETLEWLTASTVEAGSLRTLKLRYLTDTQAEKGTLVGSCARLVQATAENLVNLSLAADENGFQESGSGPDLSYLSSTSLESLSLGGRGLTLSQWQAIPKSLFSSLKSLAVDFTPALPPVEIITTLREMAQLPSRLKTLTLNGQEDYRRSNARRLTHPDEGDMLWIWSRLEYKLVSSLMSSLAVELVADRAIVVGPDDEEEEEDEEEDDAFDMDADPEVEFTVTAEQWAEERRIEREEMERTYESGSEY